MTHEEAYKIIEQLIHRVSLSVKEAQAVLQALEILRPKKLSVIEGEKK